MKIMATMMMIMMMITYEDDNTKSGGNDNDVADCCGDVQIAVSSFGGE